MGLSGMAAGASDALQELLTRAFVQQQQQQQMALQQQAADRQAAAQRQQADQFNQRQSLDERQFAADQAARAGQVDRQAMQDRQGQNKVGVQHMIGDFLMQRGAQPMDQGARNQIAGMAIGEGVDVPASVTSDPGQAQRERIELENLRNRNELQQIAAAGAQSRQTNTAKTPAASGPSPYSAERNTRTLQSVDELINKVGGMTTGLGSLTSIIPGTPARDFSSELDTLKANIAFNELTEMREASKTGGALGSVAVRELALLESTLGALDQGQSPENLKAQLQKVRENIIRWQAAKGGGAAPMPAHQPAAPQQTPGPNRVGRFEIVSVQ